MKNFFTYPSLAILQRKISELFHQRGLAPAFPGSGCDLVWPSSPVIDVVLFGDALEVLLHTDSWPRHHRYRLWVLNGEHRKVIMRAFGFQKEEIGIIPRNLLVHHPKKFRPFPQRGHCGFVFSGRAARGKNLPLIAAVVDELRRFGRAGDLHVFGTSPHGEYEQIFASHPFVKIHGNVGAQWIKKAPPNPVLVNLTLELTDDFCVSCAEAEEAGWPLIIPDRGPYREITGASAIRIPIPFIRAADASGIAKFIAKNWQKKGVFVKRSRADLASPVILEVARVARKHLNSDVTELVEEMFRKSIPSPAHDKLLQLLEKQ